MNKLSVILCVYNTDEKMFETCLKSVFDSSVKDLEVIVVDDGSTKDYSKILQNFDVKYFKTENRGTLSARIFGVKQATSPYISFVDSDDTISFNYFEASLNSIKDADIVLNDWAYHTESAKYVCLDDSTINSKINSINPLQLYFSKRGKEHSYYVLWNKIFKREILLSACLRVENLMVGRMVYAEDVLLTYFAFKVAKKVVNTHLGYYFYRVHSSQEVQVQNEEKLKSQISSLTQVFDILELDLKENNLIEYIKDLNEWKQLLCSSNYMVAKRFKSKSLNDFILKKYKNCQLKKALASSSFAYSKHELLPNNLQEIDERLKKVYYSKTDLKVFAKKNGYAYKCLTKMKEMKSNFELAKRKDADILFPKEKVSLKQKIIHNPFVFKIGILLFPKGSRIRNFLKRKL